MKTLSIKMKAKEAKAIIDLMAALNVTDIFDNELNGELDRLIKEVDGQLKAGNKTVALESDLDTLSDDDFKKLEDLDEFNLDLDGLLDEDEISTIEEVIDSVVSDSPDDGLATIDGDEAHQKHKVMQLYPKSDKDIRYSVFMMEKKGEGFYTLAVAINPDGTINRVIDCLAQNQKRDEYVDRPDKFYDELLQYLYDHFDDPSLYHSPFNEYNIIECCEKAAIHTLRKNVFKTHEEYMEHWLKCSGID